MLYTVLYPMYSPIIVSDMVMEKNDFDIKIERHLPLLAPMQILDSMYQLVGRWRFRENAVSVYESFLNQIFSYHL